MDEVCLEDDLESKVVAAFMKKADLTFTIHYNNHSSKLALLLGLLFYYVKEGTSSLQLISK